MKKVSLIKGILVILLSIMLIGTTAVFAATEEYDFNKDDGEPISSSVDKNNTNSNNGNSNKNNTNANKNNTNVNKNNTNKNNTNSSNYNNTNTNLPKTGIEDSIPTAVLIVVFGISAVYAYKKISDYKNV